VIEGPSTRLLLHVGSLIADGIRPRRACDVALAQALSDDPDVQAAIHNVVNAVFAA
jgi:nitric oxide reductase NorQ protein